jgi:hypothetical protein
MMAMYDYVATKNDELSFLEGDIINVTNQVSGGWWEGQKESTGEIGWFPSNYVGPLNEVRFLCLICLLNNRYYT